MKYWFGELPQGWSAIKLKHLTQLRQEEATDKANYIGLENIEPGTLCICGKLRNSTEGGAIRFSKSDVLFNKLRPYLKKVWVAQFEGCASKEILVMRPLKINSTYLSFVLLSPGFIELVNGSTYGAKMPRADWSFIGNQWIPVPPPRIQKDIAKRLREYLLKINILILENHEKLSHLAEYRQSLITQAVTKGLDPNAELKDSGFEWIGKIPSQWSISRLRRHLKDIGSGSTPKDKTVFQCESEPSIAWLNTGDLNDGVIVLIPKKIKLSCSGEVSLKIYPKDSVVIAMYGATIGKLGILSFPSTTNQACCILYPSSEIDNRYLFYYLRMARAYLLQLGRGSGQPNISQELIGNLPFIFPPLKIQREIVQFLKKKCSAIDMLTEKIKSSIEKLKEYRSSLISAAVTGKLNIEEAKYEE